MTTPNWKTLTDHVMAIPEGVYENNGNNITSFGAEYGENGVAWCVIFNWCTYNEVGYASLVPKTDNCNTFISWANSHARFSAYPSVGAWVSFNGGSHCEVVVGFDADHIFTKGGNTIPTGAVDNGIGYGVYLHNAPGHLRRDGSVDGYLAPHFSDGVCPPTADPADSRGGAAVTSYVWSPTDPVPNPPPSTLPILNAANVTWAAQSYASTGSTATQTSDTHAKADVLLVQQSLKRVYPAFDYSSGPGIFGGLTTAQYSTYQQSKGFSGTDANGVPGITTLTMLATQAGVYSIGSSTTPPPPPPPGNTPGAITWQQMTGWNLKGTFASGDSACRGFITQACQARGVAASSGWLNGMATIAARESASNSPSFQINSTDSNAVNVAGLFNGGNAPDGFKGQCSRGVAQCIPQTFCTYHQAGTSTSIYDPVANFAASMNYVIHVYGVASDGHNLAALVQQADPNRPPKGY